MSSLSPNWQTAPAVPELRPGAVHLWRKTLGAPEVEACAALAPSEWARAGRFHFQRDRDRYLCTHAFVRATLGGYLGQSPEELHFAANEHGKPCLEETDSLLRFNLSHSEDLLLLAVTHAREIGVDVESLRANVPFEDLADHYFSSQETAELRALPPEQRALHFFELWTATEARLKALGTGLPGVLPPPEENRWCWRNLIPAEGFAAAVAVEGGNFNLECWTCPS